MGYTSGAGRCSSARHAGSKEKAGFETVLPTPAQKTASPAGSGVLPSHSETAMRGLGLRGLARPGQAASSICPGLSAMPLQGSLTGLLSVGAGCGGAIEVLGACTAWKGSKTRNTFCRYPQDMDPQARFQGLHWAGWRGGSPKGLHWAKRGTMEPGRGPKKLHWDWERLRIFPSPPQQGLNPHLQKRELASWP